MKNRRNKTNHTIAIAAMVLALGAGFSVNKADAQYNNGGYNDNSGYNDPYNNGYNDPNNNGYNQYDNGYGNDYGDYQVFYDDLSPYGQWYNDPQYGYVWSPSGVGSDFRPYYSNGYWQMTNYGNMWMSNYAWGWAPFHYGRWVLGNFGWVWIPGRQWGPAWVSWRQGGGYYGWAPMGPGISINISFGNDYYSPDPWWTFIPCGQIYNHNFRTYYSPRRTSTIIHNTTIINNTYVDRSTRNTYITGPNQSQVQTATRQQVNVMNVGNRSTAGASTVSGRSVNVYRPEIAKATAKNTASPRSVKPLSKSIAPANSNVSRQVQSKTNNGNRQTNVAAPNRVNNQVINQQPVRTTAPAVNQVQARQQVNQQRAAQKAQVQQQRNVQQQQVQQQRSAQQQQAAQQRQQVQQQADQQRAAQQQQAQMQRQQAQQQASQQRAAQQQQAQMQRQQASQQRAAQQQQAQMQRQQVQQQASPQRVERPSAPQRTESAPSRSTGGSRSRR